MRLLQPALVGLTLRQMLARRRWLLLSFLYLLPVLVALSARSLSELAPDDAIALLVGGLTTLVLAGVTPITALILAHAALGTEVEDGTLTFLLNKPIPRSSIVFSKYLSVAGVAVLGSGMSTLLAANLAVGKADSQGLVTGLTLAAMAGAMLYGAIFLALSLISRRGLLVGLVYLLVWEGVLGRLFVGTRPFSVRQYLLSLMSELGPGATEELQAHLPFSVAWKLSLLVLMIALGLSLRRLQRVEIRGGAG